MNVAPFQNTAQPAVLASNVNEIVDDINPSIRSAASSAMLPRVLMMRACYGGTETMRQMGEVFLPRFREETIERWRDRLTQTACTNKLQEAVNSASAKPFRNLLKLRNSTPELDKWVWNADGCGHHLHIVGHQLFNEAVLTGVSHILTDHQSTTNVPSLAAERSAGAQPFLRLIKVEDMLGAYYDTVGGEYVCVHARFSSSRVAFNRLTFREQIIDQVYVVEPGVCQIWERERPTISQIPPRMVEGGSIYTPQPVGLRYEPYPVTNDGAAGKWKLVKEVPHGLDRVPLVSMVAGEEEAQFQVRPVFQDLAYKQVEHWRSTSEQRNILSSARFPMLASSGVEIDENGPDGEGFKVGPWVVLTSPDPQGRWYFVEPKGNAIKAGAEDIASIEYQMDMMALNPVQATNRQYVPQNERSLAETRVNSIIHDMAIGCQDALQKAIGNCGRWSGDDYSGVVVDMNFNFSGTDELQGKIDAIQKAVSNGTLSRRGALTNLIRLNLLAEDFDVEKELKEPAAQAELTQQKTESVETGSGAGGPKPPKGERDFGGGKTRPD